MNDTHKLTVDGVGDFDVPAGKRVVLALEDEAGLDQLHACGGVGKCTTCRVTIVEGQASPMTGQEQETLRARELLDETGLRLSCQMTMDADLTVKAESRLAGSNRQDAGPRPADTIQPPPVFVHANEAQQERPDERV
jgi:ferredoxin